MKSTVHALLLLLIGAMLMGCASQNPAEIKKVEAVAVEVEEPVIEEPLMTSPEDLDPSQMMPMRGEFPPENMPFELGAMPMGGEFDPGRMMDRGGFNGGGMNFSITPSEPIEFTVDESDLLYEVSTKSVSSPAFAETYHDAADIPNIEEYEIVVILLNGDSFITAMLPDGVSVEKKEDIIEINNSTSRKYNYYLEGSFEGTIAIKSDSANYVITLNDVELKGKALPAMQLKSGTKAFFYSAEGSINRISDSDDNEKKGAITASGDIIFSGKGEIEVTAYKKHGLKVDGTVRVLSGSLIINCDEYSEGNGISADDAYIQDGGNVEIYAYGSVLGEESKGIKVNGREGDNPKGYLVINGGTITIDSVGKALTAGFEADEDGETEATEDDPIPNVFINNGVVKVTTTGEIYEHDDISLSPEGIEAKNNLVINGGLIEVCATDDALNAGGNIVINSGSLFAYTRAADGLDANAMIIINGGLIVALGSTMPEMAIDCDNDNNFIYNGGYLVALSGAGAQSPSRGESKGYVFSIGGGFASGESFALLDSTGSAILAFTVPANFDRANSGIIASSDIVSGETYRLLRNVEISADYFFNGAYFANITVAGGEETASAAPASAITVLGGGNRGGLMTPPNFDPNAMGNRQFDRMNGRPVF
ncbi:MAG: carbohydrate-binding domain-containing protein [Spirochaetales bacterium]|nr:carbohydrate-binding domain-containing protein [Spirochaetales bacterium]